MVELHEFEHREEGHNHLAAAAHIGEERLKLHASAHGNDFQQVVDLAADGVAVIDDLADVVGLLEALEHALEGTNEVEDTHLSDGSRQGIKVRHLGIGGEEGIATHLLHA